MKPYKYHDVPNFEVISEKLYQFVQDASTELKLDFFNRFYLEEFLPYAPELTDIFQYLNVSKKNTVLAIIKVDPRLENAPHTDVPPGNNLAVGLNWPIFNCEDTYTVFYKRLNDKYNAMLLDNNEMYYCYAASSIEEEYRVKINKPTAIRVDVPHNIINNTNLPRYTASFRFENPPWHLLDKQPDK